MNVDQRKLRKIMESIFSQEAQDNFRRGEMWRSAEMTVNLNVPFGIFSLVGADVAPKVLKARGDRTTEILEALAFAYKEMKDRVDPEGQYYATYVNHVENLLLSSARRPGIVHCAIRCGVASRSSATGMVFLPMIRPTGSGRFANSLNRPFPPTTGIARC